MSLSEMEGVVWGVEGRMEEVISRFEEEAKKMRVGRVSPSLLDCVRVESYGEKMAINQLGTVSILDGRTIGIEPWDKKNLKEIERGINKAGLGVTCNHDGNMLCVRLPVLTEEGRKAKIKLLRVEWEKSKVSIRNIRREVNDRLKKLKKEKELSEDEEKKGGQSIQKLTDEYIKKLTQQLEKKEKEIIEI